MWLFLLFQSVFLQGLLGRNLQYLKTLSNEQLPQYTINLVHVRGQERYLMVSFVECRMSDCMWWFRPLAVSLFSLGCPH